MFCQTSDSSRSVRALVVDDSALYRRLLTDLLEADGRIEVVDTAVDAYVARRKIKALEPDVLTLDVEMDRMDGITFLRNLMRLRPMPVVMVSSLTERGADVTLEALSLGAVDFVAKPKYNPREALHEQSQSLRDKVIAASQVQPRRLVEDPPMYSESAQAATDKPNSGRDQIIALGASTGGTEALRVVLSSMPSYSPAIVIAQHIPESFSAAFAQRLDQHCALHVREATDGEAILPGHAYVAPGNQHLRVEKGYPGLRCRLSDDAEVSGHRPSVDVLFDSVAKSAGKHARGALLTGMGSDGAAGLLAMRRAGARTICQDRESSVVWGMPGKAVALKAVESVVDLNDIAGSLIDAR